MEWLARRDRDLAALRRAARAAIVMPGLFAIGDKVIGNPSVATFAAFGAFAMVLLVDFRGPLRVRLQEQAALALVGGVFICIGTLASRAAWLAALAMAVVGFAVLFAGVVSSVLAAAATALLLAFILPTSLAAPASSIPDRLAGWGMAAGAAMIAIAVLWPAPSRDQLRGPVMAACTALAERLRADVAYVLAGGSADSHDGAGRDRLGGEGAGHDRPGGDGVGGDGVGGDGGGGDGGGGDAARPGRRGKPSTTRRSTRRGFRSRRSGGPSSPPPTGRRG